MRTILKWNKANDINGNGVGKIFYSDNTTEIIKGGKFYELENKMGNSSFSKYYHSLSGLYASK